MEPLSLIGVAAIGAAGACAATGCIEPKQPPPVALTQRAEAPPPEPPRCPSPSPPSSQATCAPPPPAPCPSPPPAKPRKIVVQPPKVEVSVSCPADTQPRPSSPAPNMVVTNVMRQGIVKPEAPRPAGPEVPAWIWKLVANEEPRSPASLLTLIGSLAITVNIPIMAGVRIFRRGRKRR